MNYDQHYPGGEPGAVAGQDWFLKNLQDALKVIPKEKIICAVGNYGYDWAMKKGQKKGTPPADVHNVSVQDAWLEASDAATDVDFDGDCHESALRLPGRQQRPPRCVVSRWRHRPEPDAQRACPGHLHLCAVAAGLRGPFAVGGVGPALRGQCARQARDRSSRTGRGHRRPGRNPAH